MSARKKWVTTSPDIPGAPLKRHESKAALYRYVIEQRRLWAHGALRSPHLHVKVDDDASGHFDLYERIDLREEGPA